MGDTLLHHNNRRLLHTKGPSRQLHCHAIVQHTAGTNAATRTDTRGGLHVSVHTLHAAILFFGACLPGFAVSISRSVLQAKEAVANLPLRLAVRVHSGHPVWRGTLGVLNMHSMELTPWHALGEYCLGTVRSEDCAAVGRARLPSFSCRLERACANDRVSCCRGCSCL